MCSHCSFCHARIGSKRRPEWGWLGATAPFASVPPEARWSLPLLYVVFAIVVAALYVPCRWYARVRASLF